MKRMNRQSKGIKNEKAERASLEAAKKLRSGTRDETGHLPLARRRHKYTDAVSEGEPGRGVASIILISDFV